MEATTDYKNSAISELKFLIEKAKAAIEIEQLFSPLFPGAIQKRYDQWLEEINDNDPTSDHDTSLLNFYEENTFTMTQDKLLHCECYYDANFEYVNNEWIELDE